MDKALKAETKSDEDSIVHSMSLKEVAIFSSMVRGVIVARSPARGCT